MKHTELPWVIDERPKLKFNFYSDDATGSIVGTVDGFKLAPRSDEEKEANAEFIVKAVNNHYQLVDTLKEVEYFLTQINPVHWPSRKGATQEIEAVREAIKQAEES